MKQLVQQIVTAIVDDEKSVQINEIEGGASIVLQILVAKSDLGKVIGKQGKIAQSIRNIVFAASFKTKKRYIIDINSKE